MTETTKIETTKLNNGATVLAKLVKGDLQAVTYANRTQAERKAAELGEGWAVRAFRGYPFYVVKVVSSPKVTCCMGCGRLIDDGHCFHCEEAKREQALKDRFNQ